MCGTLHSISIGGRFNTLVHCEKRGGNWHYDLDRGACVKTISKAKPEQTEEQSSSEHSSDQSDDDDHHNKKKKKRYHD